MWRFVGAAVCWLAMATGVMWAQSEKDAEKVFQKSVVGEQLILRNFSAESVVQARRTGSGVEFEEPYVRMAGIVVVDMVKVRSREVEISGKRYPVVKDGMGGRKPGPEVSRVEVVVDLGGEDRKAAFAGLRDGLFFATYEDAMAVLPKNHGGNGPRDDRGMAASSYSPRLAPERMCDCADKGTEACKGLVPAGGWTSLRVVRSAEPEFSEEARAKKIGGNVMVSLTVGTTGKAANVWIERPMGYGLDEKAAQAVLKYEFQPAACHEQRFPTAIHVDVNFQIF
jgi:TonB family protein